MKRLHITWQLFAGWLTPGTSTPPGGDGATPLGRQEKPRSWADEEDELTRFMELDDDGNLTGRDSLAKEKSE